MIPLYKRALFVIVLFGLSNSYSKECLLIKKDADIEIDFWGLYKPELFAAKNFTFLNNNVPEDVIFYFRHTNDYFLDLVYGKETYGHPVAEFKTSVRNRAVWGSPSSIANTLPAEAPFLNAEVKPHYHALPRLFFWMREIWLQVGLCEFLHLGFENRHQLTVGSFPFELGRGISLGAAYAIGPGPLGFYSDSMIDQFAFGLKLSGDVIPKALSYDLYGALLQSKSSTMDQTAAPIMKNEIGRRENPARGFGKDNYLIAGRLIWVAYKHDSYGKVSFEPYAFFNDDPEQKVEFPADASSRLGTFGLAGEYLNGAFECGFDAAFNRGQQFVRPWDRNQIVTGDYNGQVVLVNSQVLISSDNEFNGLKAPEVPKSQGQQAINASAAVGSAAQNGQPIPGAQNLTSLGYVQGPLSLVNSPIRFRTTAEGEGYANRYTGWMAVTDASYWLSKEIQIAATLGYASGGHDPNLILEDKNFNGFVSLQEVYAGKRVKNVFLMGVVGKVKRPGSTPENPLANRDFASSTSGFTNLGFAGMGYTWKPAACCDSRFVLNPNVIAYWEPNPSKKFDAYTGADLPERASKYLGTEFNLFLSYYPFASLKCFAIGSLFLTGKHFSDIKGKPSSPAQKRALQKWQQSPSPDPKLIPNIGDDNAYTINFGFEFAF